MTDDTTAKEIEKRKKILYAGKITEKTDKKSTKILSPDIQFYLNYFVFQV